MSKELMNQADAVCAAVRKHAAAAANTGDDRAEAGAALVRALDEYGAAVINAGYEPPDGLDDFDAYLDEEDGVHHPEDEPELGDRVAVFVRGDFLVEDLDALRAAAIEQMQACCPVPVGEDPAESVRDARDAVAQLLGHHKPVFDEERMQEHGLRLTAEFVDTAAVEPLAEDADDYPWGALLQMLDDDEGEAPAAGT